MEQLEATTYAGHRGNERIAGYLALPTELVLSVTDAKNMTYIISNNLRWLEVCATSCQRKFVICCHSESTATFFVTL